MGLGLLSGVGRDFTPLAAAATTMTITAAIPIGHQPSLAPLTKKTTPSAIPITANSAQAVVLESSKREFAWAAAT